MDNNGMYDSLLEKVRHFVALYEKVKAEKAELEQKIVNAQKQISFLQNENNQLKTDNELLNMKLSDQSAKLAELTEKVSSQNNVNSEIESKLMAILSALPDDKDDSNSAALSSEQVGINIEPANQVSNPEASVVSTADETQQEEDPADAILNKFMSYDTETDNNNGYIGNIGSANEPALQDNTSSQDYAQPQTDEVPVDSDDNEQVGSDNDINDYVGLFGETDNEVASANDDQPTLFSDTLPTEEEWNGSAASTDTPAETGLLSDQSDSEPAMAFFDEQNNQDNNSDTSYQSVFGTEQQSSEPVNQPADSYAANDIQSDDYSSILLSDDDSDEEVDFDMDEDDDESDDDMSGSDYEDGYAPGVM